MFDTELLCVCGQEIWFILLYLDYIGIINYGRRYDLSTSSAHSTYYTTYCSYYSIFTAAVTPSHTPIAINTINYPTLSIHHSYILLSILLLNSNTNTLCHTHL